MAKGSVDFTRLVIGSVAVGTLAIVVGNLQIAMGDSYRLRVIGETVRYVGLCICTMTAIVFLNMRGLQTINSRLRKAAATRKKSQR